MTLFPQALVEFIKYLIPGLGCMPVSKQSLAIRLDTTMTISQNAWREWMLRRMTNKTQVSVCVCVGVFLCTLSQTGQFYSIFLHTMDSISTISLKIWEFPILPCGIHSYLEIADK